MWELKLWARTQFYAKQEVLCFIIPSWRRTVTIDESPSFSLQSFNSLILCAFASHCFITLVVYLNCLSIIFPCCNLICKCLWCTYVTLLVLSPCGALLIKIKSYSKNLKQNGVFDNALFSLLLQYVEVVDFSVHSFCFHSCSYSYDSYYFNSLFSSSFDRLYTLMVACLRCRLVFLCFELFKVYFCVSLLLSHGATVCLS